MINEYWAVSEMRTGREIEVFGVKLPYFVYHKPDITWPRTAPGPASLL
jgi:hypothetical protein